MLTISQLAGHAGVTVAAVRHYHKIGLLPEPERDRSGYRSYDAAAVVRLIRIHTLASAGVPLAQVEALLDAEQEDFAERLKEIDKRIRAEIRRLQSTRQRLARLAAGEKLALPASVVSYLDRLRGLGVDERYIELERDAWIVMAAQVPDQIETIMAKKHRDLDDPDIVRLYGLLSSAPDWTAEDPRVVEVADVLDRITRRAFESGDWDEDGLDENDGEVVALLDATMAQTSPAAKRLRALLRERGWKGWTRFERAAAEGDPGKGAGTGSEEPS